MIAAVGGQYKMRQSPTRRPRQTSSLSWLFILPWIGFSLLGGRRRGLGNSLIAAGLIGGLSSSRSAGFGGAGLSGGFSGGGGGFGGGGAGLSHNEPAGGGGYSGGGGGGYHGGVEIHTTRLGGGGGSFAIEDTNPYDSATHKGNGKVIITLLN